jgi:hypothetical protein
MERIAYLGVAISEENRNTWVVCDEKASSEPPLAPYWSPRCRLSCQQFEGMLSLGPNVYCVQRGYFPQFAIKHGLWKQFIEVAAARFHHSEQMLEDVLKPYAWDFMVFVLANRKSKCPKLVSGGLVEYRNSDVGGKVPYLYIGELCTHVDYEHEGLASMLCHGTYQLGNMMLKGALRRRMIRGTGVARTMLGAALEGEESAVWENVIRHSGNVLYVALMVKQPTKEMYHVLVHLYSHCGFRGTEIPDCLDFESITPYSPYPYLPYAKHCDDGFCAAMHKMVQPGVIYEGLDLRILDPLEPPTEDSRLLVHSFEAKYLDFVRENGLVLHRQHSLFADWAGDEVYFADQPCGIFFSSDYCYREGVYTSAVFVIRVEHELQDDHVHSALPTNVAVFIGEASVYKEKFEAEILTQQKKREWTLSNVCRRLFHR